MDMDIDDFPISPAKRQRTNSPEEDRHAPAHAEDKINGSLSETSQVDVAASTIPGLGGLEERISEIPPTKETHDSQDPNSLLDALMLQVEAESSAIAPVQPPSTDPVLPTESALEVQYAEQTQEVERHESNTDGGPEKSETGPATEASAAPIEASIAMTQDTIVDDVGEDNTMQEAMADVKPDTSGPTPTIGNTADAPAAPAYVERSMDVIPSEESQAPGPDAEGAEWEVDSSPYDSSSDSDSSDDTTSSDEDSDEDADGEYSMLDPEETARLLMQEDGGSDDEGGRSRDKAAAPLRTANERQEEVIPKPDIVVTEDMKIEELGNVEVVVENTVVIKAKTSGEYQVLEPGSLICLDDRSVVGVVADLIGRVEEPRYTVRFTNDEAIADAGLSQTGTTVFYVPQHSTFVFTQPLKSVKGSDASNFHDEEVAEDEMEFSDDEAEAEHKRQVKAKRQGRSGDTGRGRGGSKFARGSQRGGRGEHHGHYADNNGYGSGSLKMNYDDVAEGGDEGYTPLQRPDNMTDVLSKGDQPQEWSQGHPPPPPSTFNAGRGGFGGRGRGQGRGRGGFRGNRGGGGFNQPRAGGFNRQQHNANTSQTGYAPTAPELNLPTTPSITPHNISYPPTTPSPMTPLPNGSFNFGGFQPPPNFPFMPQLAPGYPPSFPPNFQQQQQYQQPYQQPYQQQFHQPYQPPPPQQSSAPGMDPRATAQQSFSSGPWSSNPAIAAALRRHAEEQRRNQGM
ncbi:hypothetical protein H2202_001262 [Exophiala xenobiotica]|nr:hypothetical protein H2202_001262 [Exophiala xenobiotica]